MIRSARVNWSKLWLHCVVGVSLVMLIMGLIPVKSRYWYLFHFAWENNVAAWWSGMLLLIAALHAFDGYVLLERSKPNVAQGWAAISLILTVLSIDEIGSIHERMDRVLHLGTWWSLLPFALILLSLLGYALVSFWLAREPLRKVALLAFAFALFGTVAFQEFLEHHIAWASWTAVVRGFIEEGTELLGILILLSVCMGNSRGIFGGRNGPSPTLELIHVLRAPILVMSLTAAPFLAYLSAVWPDQWRGHPASWLAAALFLFAALGNAKRFLEYGDSLSVSDWGLVLLCGAASVCSVACRPTYSIDFPVAGTNLRALVFFLLSLPTCVLLIFGSRYAKKTRLSAAIAVAGLVSFALFHTSLFTLYALPALVGIPVYYVSSARNQRPEALASDHGAPHPMPEPVARQGIAFDYERLKNE